jgi:CTP-dependent riboflavin kinase
MIGEFERLVLISICKATGGSKSAHVPRQYFMKKFQENRHQKKQAEKALKSLIARGYVYPHPTARETIYQMTDAGLEICRQLKAEALEMPKKS